QGRADEEKGKGKGKDKGKDEKPNVVQIDLNKLPPDIAKRLLELSQAGDKKAPDKGKTAPVKSISLSEAIAVAEKATKGQAIRADRREEDGEVTFRVEIRGGEGARKKVVVSAAGKVLSGGDKKKDEYEKGKDEKGKGKEEEGRDD